MKFKTNQKIIWTSLELGGLLEEDDSCVHFTRTKKHLALHPFYLKNLQKALNEILMSQLNTYDTELKGFLIAYKNPKLLSNLGDTFYDSYFIHVDIEADFYLFCPKVGCSLKGIVNKKGLDHIVLLVHKIFNVTIPKPDNEQEEWLGNTVEIGHEIKCHVTQIDRSTKPLSIYATLNTDYLQGCRLSEIINNTYNADTDVKSSMNNIEEMANGLDITVSENDVTLNEESPVKIKIENPDTEEYNTNSSGYAESRKKKKRKHSDADVASEPERKKKKKHAKKSRESNSELALVDNEDKKINNHIEYPKEERQEKKHKKGKKAPMIMSDSEPENDVKIKVEKPDLEVDEIINRSFTENLHNDKSDYTECTETNIHIKTEDSDKEKKKRSKKREKTSKNRNSESEIKIKNEDKIIKTSE